MKPNILIINYGIPYPTRYGGDEITLERIKRMANKYDLSYACIADKKLLDNAAYLNKYCKKIYILPIDVDRNIKKKIISLLKYKELFQLIKRIALVINGVPINIVRIYHLNFCKRLKEIISLNNYDIIQFEHLMMGQYINELSKILKKSKTIFVEHAIPGLELKRTYENYKGIKKIYFKYQSFIAFKYEKRLINKFDHIITLSNIEKQILIKLGLNKNNITVIPMGVDISKNYNEISNVNEKSIVFLGNTKLLSNKNGLIWFLEKAFPLIKKSIGNVVLIVIGENDAEIVKRYSNNNVIFKGFLTKIDEEMCRGRLFIAPILIGAGIRIKVFKAMSYGLPIVTTSVGIEGIETNEKCGVFIADSYKEFANISIKLLKNREYLCKCGEEAKIFVEKYYSWESIILKIDNLYKYI